MSDDSTNLLMAMVEKVCAPVLEQVLDKIELQALQEASARLRTENAELRKALKLPHGAGLSADSVSLRGRRHRPRTAVLTPPPGPEAPAPGAESASSLPAQDATILLWPFAKAPLRVQQLIPAGEALPAWVILYQSALSEAPDTARTLAQLRTALRTATAPREPVRRRTPSRFLEFIW